MSRATATVASFRGEPDEADSHITANPSDHENSDTGSHDATDTTATSAMSHEEQEERPSTFKRFSTSLFKTAMLYSQLRANTHFTKVHADMQTWLGSLGGRASVVEPAIENIAYAIDPERHTRTRPELERLAHLTSRHSARHMNAALEGIRSTTESIAGDLTYLATLMRGDKDKDLKIAEQETELCNLRIQVDEMTRSMEEQRKLIEDFSASSERVTAMTRQWDVEARSDCRCATGD